MTSNDGISTGNPRKSARCPMTPAPVMPSLSTEPGRPTVGEFLQTLFDPGEHTCFAEHARGTKVHATQAIEVIHNRYAFLSINPLNGVKDNRPTESYHRSDRPRRADHNVVVYRNILIECDKIPLKDQQPYIESLGMPYSTKVYSGGKSYHYIISLAVPLSTREEYDRLVRSIHKIVTKADKTTKNPSRLSRYPGHFREDKGRVQDLLEIKGRISNEVIHQWLSKHKILVEEPKARLECDIPSSPHLDSLNGFTKNFLMFGADEGERNNRLFLAACNCREVGLQLDQAVEVLSPVLDLLGHDFSHQEFYATISSAYSR